MGGHFCVCVKCIAFEEPTQWHLGGNTQIPEKAARDVRLSLCQRGEIKLSRDATGFRYYASEPFRSRLALATNLATPTTRKDLQARSARRRKNVRREELMGGHFCVCVKCIAFEEPTQWHLGGNTQIPEKAARDVRLSLCQRGETKLSRDAPRSSAITRARGVGGL